MSPSTTSPPNSTPRFKPHLSPTGSRRQRRQTRQRATAAASLSRLAHGPAGGGLRRSVPAFAAAALGRLTVERSLPDRVAVSGLPGSRPLTCLAFGDPISGERAASSPTSCYTIMSLPASQQYRNLRPPTDTSPPVNATGVRPALISCQAVRDRFPGLGTARSRSWSSQPEDGAGGGRGLSHGCGDAEGEQGDQGKVEHRPGGGAQHRPVAQRQRRVAACRVKPCAGRRTRRPTGRLTTLTAGARARPACSRRPKP
jgi:hypothetical protein